MSDDSFDSNTNINNIFYRILQNIHPVLDLRSHTRERAKMEVEGVLRRGKDD